MVSDDAAANGDTQKLNADSLPHEDYGCAMPQDGTFSVYDDTEVVKEGLCLFGETQVVDDGLEYGTWIDTQVEGDWGETCAVDDDGGDEDLERTEVLSDCVGGLSDDAGTEGCGWESGNVGESHNSEDRSRNCSADLNLGASTGGCSCPGSGSMKKSFASVRTASLRASGLAASRSMTRSSAESLPDKSQCSMQGTSARVILSHEETENINMRDHACLFEGKVREPCSNFKMKHYPSLRKVFKEKKIPKDDSVGRTVNCSAEEGSAPTLACDYLPARLSYIDSQEPGELSQANALNVVDNFLYIHDVGLSQDACLGKTSEIKLPHVMNAKGGHCLAKSAQKSPVGKGDFFYWNDAIEDEGGVDFFSTRSSSSYKNKYTKKIKNQDPKTRHSVIGSWNENANTESPPKAKRLCLSDSRINMHHSEGSQKLKNSEATTKIVDQMEQHVVDTDLGMDADGLHDIGPDTQLAAEAMESLFYGVAAEDSVEAHPVAGNSTNDINMLMLKKGFSDHVTFQEKVSDSVVLTRSKAINFSSSKPGCRNPRSSRKQSKKSELKPASTERKMDNTEPRVDGPKPKENSAVIINLHENNGISSQKSLSNNGDKTVKKAPRSFPEDRKTRRGDRHSRIKKMGSDNAQVSNVRQSLSKEIVPEVMAFTPVAYRTRRAEAAQPSRRVAVSSDSHACGLTQKISCESLSPDHRLSGEQPVVESHTFPCTSLQDRHHPEIILNQLHLPEIDVTQGIRSLIVGHPKRRRTCLKFSTNSKIAAKPRDPLSSCAVIPGSNSPISTKHDNKCKSAFNHGIITKGTVDRKAGAVARCLPSDVGKIFANAKNRLKSTGARTKSSVNPLRFVSLTESHCVESSKEKALFENSLSSTSCSTSAINEKALNRETTKVLLCKDAICCSKNQEDFFKLDVSMNEPVRSPTAFPLLSNNITKVSPVCTGTNPMKKQNRRYSSRSSLVKELRLESAEMALISPFKEMRKRRDISSIRVLFSCHLDDDVVKQQKKILARLGIQAASSISDATHFIADKFVRTRNMLEAMSVGKPVVTHLWLESCGQANCFLDEKNYLLRDLKKENEIGFNMPASLAHAFDRPLLAGRRVFITPNAKPDRATVSSLVKTSGGQTLDRIGRSISKDGKIPDDLLVISCEEDYTICSPILEKGALVFDSELLLNGIVIQKLEYERHRLFFGPR